MGENETLSQNCTHDCASCKENCSERTSFLEKPHEMSRVKKVIGIISGKGGVGKSLVTSLLAVQAKRCNLNVGILDADVTGPSVPRAFGLAEKAVVTEQGLFPVRTKTGIEVMSLNLLLESDTDPVVWRGPMIAGVVKQFWTDVIWKDIDVLFIDMPPGTGDVPLTVFQSIPIDGVVVVTTPQQLVGMIVEKAIHMASMMHVPVLGIVENMSYIACPDCGRRIEPFGESRADEIAAKYDIPLVARIPINGKLSAASDAGLIELFEGDWLDAFEKLFDADGPKRA